MCRQFGVDLPAGLVLQVADDEPNTAQSAASGQLALLDAVVATIALRLFRTMTMKWSQVQVATWPPQP